MNDETTQQRPADECVSTSAQRALAAWATDGGVLPAVLLAHIRECPACAASVRRINRVRSGLVLLQGSPVPSTLLVRSNERALSMLRRVTRASAQASRTLAVSPHLSAWQRAGLHAARLSLSAVAACLVLLTRVGVWQALDHARAGGEVLAQAHWQRHIDPHHEWLNHDQLT